LRTPRTLLPLALAGADGRDWYSHAHAEILRVAPHLGVPPQVFADYLALFSPRVSVARSIKWAIHYVRTYSYMHDCTVSHRLAVMHYRRTGEIRGPKTSAFARAIMGDPNAVVLDVWMARALAVPQRTLEYPRVHRTATSRLICVAETLAWSPAQVQAAIWHATVREWGRRPARFTIPHTSGALAHA
jgi:hypothetical protein